MQRQVTNLKEEVIREREKRSRKRPLESEVSVWVVMQSVSVTTTEDWDRTPRNQVTLSGVLDTKEETEKTSSKHKQVLITFCKKQSKEIRNDKKNRGSLQKKHWCSFVSRSWGSSDFHSDLTVVEIPNPSVTTRVIVVIDVA